MSLKWVVGRELTHVVCLKSVINLHSLFATKGTFKIHLPPAEANAFNCV